MCEVADALKTEGRLGGKIELLLEMNFTVTEIADKLGISVETAEKIAAGISESC